jgi:hypothetical protein
MKRTKILGFIFILTIMAISFSTVEAQTTKFKTWKITVSQSGGYTGIMKSYALDNEGKLVRINKNQQIIEIIDPAKTEEIGKLIKELSLPRTKSKTVKGQRIYDGIYSSLVINLEGKDYKVEGNSFDDAKFLALTKKQKGKLEELKAKFNEINDDLPDTVTIK